MSARDSFHNVVKQALLKDNWVNLSPLILRYGSTKLEIDLGAEQVLTAQKNNVQIAIEVKSFRERSPIAIGRPRSGRGETMDTQTPLTEPQELLDQWMSDRLYRNTILEVLQDVVARFAASGSENIRIVPVFDEVHNQYQVLEMGWDESGDRIFQSIIHLELLNGKIWIQENVTDIDLGKVLLNCNVEAPILS
jgi:hypothetical protein